jgi:hypothetical protein
LHGEAPMKPTMTVREFHVAVWRFRRIVRGMRAGAAALSSNRAALTAFLLSTRPSRRIGRVYVSALLHGWVGNKADQQRAKTILQRLTTLLAAKVGFMPCNTCGTPSSNGCAFCCEECKAASSRKWRQVPKGTRRSARAFLQFSTNRQNPLM